MRYVRFELFKGTFKSAEKLCAEAAEFASSLEPQALIGMSVTHEGTVIVWYRSQHQA